ncbi:hypothetical protein SGGMMB4_03998 [Sodalis glossinidius str. 'morsitans']|uniref:Transposase n=1 Tax=Sodalis glossinidius (strain morsitans) TaxID=343509 RepID=A0A193QKZ9_SODGM|nr:hypothetical protein SGGMMB4_03998 [Sodalis glossinidius str. 'morsitans']
MPLLALAGDTYRGQTVFVRINLYNCDICGIKYTLSPEGVLREVPKKLAVHLRNIRTQGLGGKAPRRRRRWPVKRDPLMTYRAKSERNYAVVNQRLSGSNDVWKKQVGDHLSLRDYDAQVGEAMAMVKALNKMTLLGMPNSIRIA